MAAVERRTVWLAALGTAVLRLVAATWRVRVVNEQFLHAEHDRGHPVMFILWHGQLLPLLWAHRRRQIAVMISEHRDGELIARVATALGFRLVRGSSSRGAARALLGACREVEAGYDIAVTPDGPRGPARSVAPGAAAISQRADVAMLPVSASASRAWRLRSWDGFMIPKPFARVTVAYSEPIRAMGDTPRDAASDADRVRAAIDRAGEIAANQ